MSAENRNKIKEVFLAAMELEPARRAGFLEDKCGADEKMRQEIEDLIRADEKAKGLMSRPASEKAPRVLFAETAADTGGAEEEDALIGSMIGAYRLTRDSGAAAWARFI